MSQRRFSLYEYGLKVATSFQDVILTDCLSLEYHLLLFVVQSLKTFHVKIATRTQHE